MGKATSSSISASARREIEAHDLGALRLRRAVSDECEKNAELLQAVDGLALGRHGAPLGARHEFRRVVELRRVLGRQTIRAETKSGDESAMHDEVSITPDR